MKHACCPVCGYDLDKERPEIEFHHATGVVLFNGKQTRLSPVELIIFEHLIDAGHRGIGGHQLFYEIYGHDRWQDARSNIISVYISKIRRALRKVDLSIVTMKRGPGSVYILVRPDEMKALENVGGNHVPTVQ